MRAAGEHELDGAVQVGLRVRELLGERVEQVSQAAVKRVETRLSGLGGGLDRRRDEALELLERRAGEVEAGLRRRLEEIAADAEAERGVLESRLHELQRRLDELTARAS